MKYVSWSGGFDSNYIVMKHVSNGETVQPIYCLMQNDEVMKIYDCNEDYLKFRDEFSLKTITYFKNKYSDYILEPIIMDANKFYSENKEESEKLKEEVSNLEKEIKNFYYNGENVNSRHLFYLKKNILDSNYDYWSNLPLSLFLPIHIYSAMELANKMNVQLETGVFGYKNFFDSNLIKTSLGKNKEMEITDSRYTKLSNLVFPLYDYGNFGSKSKLDMAKDLIEIDPDLFVDIVENGASCSSVKKIRNTNYCYRCASCISLIHSKVMLKSNLQKIYKNRQRKSI